MKNGKIFLAVGLVLLVGFGLIPFQKKVSTLSDEGASVENVRAGKVQEYADLKDFVAQNPNVLQTLNQKIPPSADQEQIIRDLSRITKTAGLSFSQLGFSQGVDTNLGLKQLDVSFSLEGDRKKLYNFLKGIEQNERFLGMKTFGIQSAGEGDQNSLAVQIYSFFQN